MQYQGLILDGQMHGFGKLTYDNDEYYEGEWNRGKRHGRGVYVYMDGNNNFNNFIFLSLIQE